MKLWRYISVLVGMLLFFGSITARQVRVYGYVVDADNVGIEFANVYITGTNIGTTTNRNGYYDLKYQQTDTMTLAFSMMGFVTTEQRLWSDRDVVNINVMLATDAEMLEEVQVRGLKKQENSFDRVEAMTTRVMPDATGGGIESLMITFAGVRQNNELSSQYNVRGGSYEENSVYVNGIEVHRPLLLRAGQQEGLSFVNPEMSETVQFSAGGFDAEYGDKLSSVLDITYKKPRQTEASLSLSLLGANAYVGFGNQRHTELHALRYKTSKYMLGALPTAGNYQPNFVDYQTYMTWKIGNKTTKSRPRQDRVKTASRPRQDSIAILAPINDGIDKHIIEAPQQASNEGWEISLMGNFSQNTYRFIPDSISTSYGTMQQSEKLTIHFDGQEKDVFRTAFAAFGAKGKVSKEVEIGFSLSGFYTNEAENYDINGQYKLMDNPVGDGISNEEEAPKTENEGYGHEDNSNVQGSVDDKLLGKGAYHEHARNRLESGVVTLAHTGEWKHDKNLLKWGVSLQGEWTKDIISEWKWRDSMGYSLPNHEQSLELEYSMKGASDLMSIRAQGYIQDTYKWNTDAGNVMLTAGARINWWSFNKETLVSPRISVVYLPGWKRDLTIRLATGMYYQSPFYKELKDTITGDDGVTRFTLNKDLKAQRSMQVVLGSDYYFRAWGRPFKFTAEAYYKYIDRMESYTVENVKIRYSGKNDAKGYTTGLDLKLFGELVPGADSWISLSVMRSRMQLIDRPELGWLLGSNEQRYAISMLFQDYFPRLPELKFHIKFIYSDGLPYSVPNHIETQGRMNNYKRFDIGASYEFKYGRTKWMTNPHVQAFRIQGEVFNLMDFKNVNSYFWAQDYYGYLHQSPNYLTGRMFNVKLMLDLK
ncbi:MAG: TonB-dependent receptor [Paludibacteraceae bacterium]|nr:TonB-dependent receptor [Paludibacteraceae bacterium]